VLFADGLAEICWRHREYLSVRASADLVGAEVVVEGGVVADVADVDLELVVDDSDEHDPDVFGGVGLEWGVFAGWGIIEGGGCCGIRCGRDVEEFAD